ncbi:hypothetical protein F7734_28215 [Scytonema sp. UIC 10036]|uniref:hypothetical protein n=1 Tax=Scytonema sp. UIC 10036 TaxID=2304196 RepID=UPI0012DA50F0|nr:hypothetical protein [Scytonema sp. UIC 10036]MUG96021.1 hypothetical protein [Scytonema sp. UIC 10036]
MIQDTVQGESDDMYLQLMEIGQKALENAHYETAYHVLCAAMHYAYAQSNEKHLEAVAQAARNQLNWIDTHNPTHRMSSQSSVKRSGINLYQSLMTQIHADLQIIQQQRRKENFKHLPWFGDANNNPSVKEE